MIEFYVVNDAATCSSTSTILSKGVPVFLNSVSSLSWDGAVQQQQPNPSFQFMKDRSKITSLPLAATRTSFHPFLRSASDAFGIMTKNFMGPSLHAE